MKTIIEQEKIEENKELLDLIREDFYRIRPHTYVEFFQKRDDKIPSLSKLRKMFNNATYNEILLVAGVEGKYLKNIGINREECLIQLRKIVEDLGHIPSGNQFAKLGIPVNTINKLYGNYNNIVRVFEEEGYKKINKIIKINATDEELLDMYINLSNQIGKQASAEDINLCEDLPSATIFVQRFGGMNQLRKMVGFKEYHMNNKQYTKEKVMNILTDEIIKKQACITRKQLKENNDLPSEMTVLRYFKTTKMDEVNKEILPIIKEKDYELYKKLSKNQ